MSKRFTDTEKWNDPWFCSLSPAQKLFWLYICDSCDIAGFYKVNIPLLSFHIGTTPTTHFFDPFKDRILNVNNELWFIKKFVRFQQGVDIDNLNPDNNAHKSILRSLASYPIDNKESSPLLGASEGLASPPSNSKGNGNSNKDRGCGGKESNKRFIPPTIEEVRAYCKERNNTVEPERFINHYETSGWVRGKTPIKDWRACVRTWEKDKPKPFNPSKYGREFGK